MSLLEKSRQVQQFLTKMSSETFNFGASDALSFYSQPLLLPNDSGIDGSQHLGGPVGHERDGSQMMGLNYTMMPMGGESCPSSGSQVVPNPVTSSRLAIPPPSSISFDLGVPYEVNGRAQNSRKRSHAPRQRPMLAGIGRNLSQPYPEERLKQIEEELQELKNKMGCFQSSLQNLPQVVNQNIQDSLQRTLDQMNGQYSQLSAHMATTKESMENGLKEMERSIKSLLHAQNMENQSQFEKMALLNGHGHQDLNHHLRRIQSQYRNLELLLDTIQETFVATKQSRKLDLDADTDHVCCSKNGLLSPIGKPLMSSSPQHQEQNRMVDPDSTRLVSTQSVLRVHRRLL